MKDIPIIFSAPMVQALLAGRKNQTRRLAWREADAVTTTTVDGAQTALIVPDGQGDRRVRLPSPWRRVKPGDRLWVREAWAPPVRLAGTAPSDMPPETPVLYLADFPHYAGKKGRPSIHMPRWASRLTLHVEAVRVERLQEISEADARAEGVERWGDATWTLYGSKGPCWTTPTAAGSFRSLWNSLHGPDAWAANPEVVALTFRVEQRNIDAA